MHPIFHYLKLMIKISMNVNAFETLEVHVCAILHLRAVFQDAHETDRPVNIEVSPTDPNYNCYKV